MRGGPNEWASEKVIRHCDFVLACCCPVKRRRTDAWHAHRHRVTVRYHRCHRVCPDAGSRQQADVAFDNNDDVTVSCRRWCSTRCCHSHCCVTPHTNHRGVSADTNHGCGSTCSGSDSDYADGKRGRHFVKVCPVMAVLSVGVVTVAVGYLSGGRAPYVAPLSDLASTRGVSGCVVRLCEQCTSSRD